MLLFFFFLEKTNSHLIYPEFLLPRGVSGHDPQSFLKSDTGPSSGLGSSDLPHSIKDAVFQHPQPQSQLTEQVLS